MSMADASRPWSDVVPAEQAELLDLGGFGAVGSLGDAPAVLVIDVVYSFTGTKAVPVREAVNEFRTACGQVAWDAVAQIARVLGGARAQGFPVLYTRVRRRDNAVLRGGWNHKSSRSWEDAALSDAAHGIVDELRPQADDIVIDKDKPSAFFGTPLASYLNQLGADSLVLTGGTTSGCIRASAVDAFSYNYPVAIPHDAVFDRVDISHKVTLFDLQAKYADILTTDELLTAWKDS